MGESRSRRSISSQNSAPHASYCEVSNSRAGSCTGMLSASIRITSRNRLCRIANGFRGHPLSGGGIPGTMQASTTSAPSLVRRVRTRVHFRWAQVPHLNRQFAADDLAQDAEQYPGAGKISGTTRANDDTAAIKLFARYGGVASSAASWLRWYSWYCDRIG